MAIDANILLQGRSPDVGNALLKGFQGAETLQMMDIRQQQAQQTQLANQQKLQQQEYLAGILKEGVTASRLKPLIANKDLEGFKKGLAASGLPPEDVDLYSTYADAGRWEQLGQVADQTIQLARDTGVFERDYGAGGGVYTPAGIIYDNKLQELIQYARSLPEGSNEQKQAIERARQFATIVAKEQAVQFGGKVEGFRQSLLPPEFNITVPDITSTGGGTGGTPPDVPTGTATNVNLEDSIDGKTTPKTTPKSPNLQQQASENAKAIARNQAIYEGAKTFSEKQAIVMSGYENDRSTYLQYKKGIERVFKNKQDQLGDLFKDVPQGSLSSVVNKAISMVVGGTTGADAEARIKQLSAMLLRGVPYDPGAQSNAELEAREELIGSLKNPNVSTEQKKQSIIDYFDMMEGRFEYGTDYLKDYYDRNQAITPPKWYRELSTQPAPSQDLLGNSLKNTPTGGTVLPAPGGSTGQSSQGIKFLGFE